MNSRQGVARLDRPVEGSDEFKSMNLSKYPDNTRLELTFRITGKQQRQLVRHVEIQPSDRFRVVLSDIEDGINYDDVVGWLSSLLDWSVAGTEEFRASVFDNKGPWNVVTGMAHRAAFTLRDDLNEKGDGMAYFEVIKHTAEDMPDTIEVNDASLGDFEYVDNFYIPEDVRPVFTACANAMASGERVNVLMTGPSGYGKTSLYQALGKWLGLEVYRLDCSLIQDTEAWYGRHRAHEGSTYFDPTMFTQLVARGRCVIILDEANRLEPWLTNSLFPLLDHDRRTEVMGMEIVVGESVIFGATMNIGIKYAGTNVVDEAWLNRMDMVAEVGPLPRVKEEELLLRLFSTTVPSVVIKQVVSVIDELRRVTLTNRIDVDVSTRAAIKLVEQVKRGLTLRQATRFVIENRVFVPEERKPIIDALNSRLGLQ